MPVFRLCEDRMVSGKISFHTEKSIPTNEGNSRELQNNPQSRLTAPRWPAFMKNKDNSPIEC